MNVTLENTVLLEFKGYNISDSFLSICVHLLLLRHFFTLPLSVFVYRVCLPWLMCLFLLFSGQFQVGRRWNHDREATGSYRNTDHTHTHS